MPAHQSLVSSFFRPRSVRAAAADDDESSAAEREETETTIPPLVCAPSRVRVRVPMELPPGWKILPLTPSGSSWVVHVRGFCPTPSKGTFREFWKKHPKEKHSLVLFGKTVWENRYSQMYSVEPAQQEQQHQQHHHQQQQQQQQQQQCGDPPGSYRYTYSGTSRVCLPCDPSERDEKFAMDLCLAADRIAPVLLRAARLRRECNGVRSSSSNNNSNNNNSSSGGGGGDQPVYNCCLVNWYTPDHTIGLHSDNEAELDPFWPILSVSWGGPRRFLLRAKPGVGKDVHEFRLRDGDLLVMGGRCQEEFKHEVPRVRKTMDGIVGDRICWTMRRLRYRTGNGGENGSGSGKIRSRQSASPATRTDGERERKFPGDDRRRAVDATSRGKRALRNPYYARRKSSSRAR